jgi:hypothetical protein
MRLNHIPGKNMYLYSACPYPCSFVHVHVQVYFHVYVFVQVQIHIRVHVSIDAHHRMHVNVSANFMFMLKYIFMTCTYIHLYVFVQILAHVDFNVLVDVYVQCTCPCPFHVFLSCYVHVQVHLYYVCIHANVLMHVDIHVYLYAPKHFHIHVHVYNMVGRFLGYHVNDVTICFQDAICKCRCYIIASKCQFQSDHLKKTLLISKRSDHLTMSADRKIAVLVLRMQFAHSLKYDSGSWLNNLNTRTGAVSRDFGHNVFIV